MTVTTGKRVSIHYTLSLPDKTEIESNLGEDPFTYTQGGKDIPAALQDALLGLRVGGTKQVTLSPKEGFGVVNPTAFQEVAKERVPEGARSVGTVLNARDQAGHSYRIRVHQVKTDTVVLDFNHPLAGKTLVFDVKIMNVEEPDPSP